MAKSIDQQIKDAMAKKVVGQTRLCCTNRAEEAVVPCTPLLADRIGLRTTQFPHPIEQLTSQRSFPLLGRIPLRPHVASERSFIAGKGILGMTLSVVPGRSFSCESTLGLDRPKMLIALGRDGGDRGAQHCIFAGRDDHPGSR
jgi:hypothetical protein